jgi:Signal transduction histidine kinase regulating C4-dicarboxylate transport system
MSRRIRKESSETQPEMQTGIGSEPPSEPARQRIAELESQLAAMESQLDQMQRLTAIGELVSTTTHEFNNILMMILNYAKMGQRHTDTATRDRCFEKILTGATRASKITSGILGMARNRSGDPEPTDLAQLVSDTLLLLEREMNKYRITIERKFTDSLPLALVIGNQIQQVLLNMLVNARQAMPDGGRITLTLKRATTTGMIDLVIRDYGLGIPADRLPKIFEPFYTTKTGPDASGKGGTGLGLSACRKIIESHHGRIIIASTLGRGTSFTLRLPIADDKEG